MAALFGYFIAALLIYGLVSRLGVLIAGRKVRSVGRLITVHAVSLVLFGLISSAGPSFDALMFSNYGVGAFIWLAFDLWRASRSGQQPAQSRQN